MLHSPTFVAFFFFNDTPTTEIYTLSLHDALPIWSQRMRPTLRSRFLTGCLVLGLVAALVPAADAQKRGGTLTIDRKSTRLNSSHVEISYAVFCLKKKKKKKKKHNNTTNTQLTNVC